MTGCSAPTEGKTQAGNRTSVCKLNPRVPLTLWKMCAPWKEVGDAWNTCVISPKMFCAQGMAARQIAVLNSLSSFSHHQLFSLPPALPSSALLPVGGWACRLSHFSAYCVNLLGLVLLLNLTLAIPLNPALGGHQCLFNLH